MASFRRRRLLNRVYCETLIKSILMHFERFRWLHKEICKLFWAEHTPSSPTRDMDQFHNCICSCGPFCAVHKLAASVSHHRLPWTVLILKLDRLYKLITLNMNAIYIRTPFLLFPYFILLVVSLRPSRAADSHLQIVLLRRLDDGCPTTTAPWQSPTRRDAACQHNHDVAHLDISCYSATHLSSYSCEEQV